MEFYRTWQNEENMIMWRTFNSFRISPLKATETGVHKQCVMLSCGRAMKQNIDKERFRQLPLKTQERLKAKYTAETLNRPNLSFRDSLINKMIGIWKASGKMLGIELEKKDENFEVYSYCKYKNQEELEPMIIGLGMGLGILAQMKRLKVQENEDYKKYLTAKFRVAYEKGLSVRL